MTTMKTTRPGSGPRAVVVGLFALFLALAPMSEAFARAGSRSGGSFGNRGAMTFQPPRTTPTAPNQASPLAPSPGMGQQAPRPGMATPAAQPKRGLFGGGFMGGLMGGLFAAGLFGMLFGGGFGAGLGGFASFLGLILQVVLIVLLVRFALRFFRNRQSGNGPAAAGAGPMGGLGQARGMGGAPGGAPGGSPFGFGGGSAPKPQPITLDAPDFDQFEAALKGVQDAYSREDIATLRRLCTAEVAGVFEQDIAENVRAGVRNVVSDVTLLQGDLSEAWREGNIDYATVAMRFSLTDRTLNRVTGQPVDGSDGPQEAVELWTFRRAPGTSWALSAIQQAG